MSQSPYSVVFFGTHHFACEMLRILHADNRIDVQRIVTQPDKPVGRKKILTPPPVKMLAEEFSIPCDQPERLSEYVLDTYDISIVAQYGKLIPESILYAPAYDTINVHTSLLPSYRGASPIQTAIANGDTVSGITIMKMDKGLDTGPIIVQKEVHIGPTDMYDDVENSMINAASAILVDSIEQYIIGDILPKEQDDSLATLCSQLTRNDGRIDWQSKTSTMYNAYRAYTPWPGVWTTLCEKRVKIFDMKPADRHIAPGIIEVKDGKLFVGTQNGSIEILSLQIEGKQQVSAVDFIRGQKNIHHLSFV